MSIDRRVVLIVLVALASQAAASPEKLASNETAVGEDDQLYSCKQGKGPVSVTFKPETEIKDLITWAMSFTCKSFMLDPRIVVTGKKVTLIVPTKLTPAEAYRVFLAALSTVGLTVVPKGGLVRIVDAMFAKKDTVPLFKKGLPDDIDQMVRYVFRPSYVQPDTIRNAFLAMKSEPGDVMMVGALVVITDYASNVRDMMSLAKMIDVPGGTDGVYTIPIRHADATKLAPKLEAFLGVTSSPGPANKLRGDGAAPPATEIAGAVPSKIMVDDRTNTLVISASEAAYLRVKAIVDRLDIALDIEGGATFHVYPLGHAIAEELAQTLTQAISGNAAPVKQPAGPQATAPDAGASLEGPVRVIGEKASNALIVMSSGRDFLAIRDMIRQLDLPRRQVFIEAMILEVGMSNSQDLGAAGHTAIPGSNGSSIVAGVQAPELKTLTTTAVAASIGGASGLIGGLLGPALSGSESLFGTSIPSYAVLFQAVATATNTNILSAPSIIAVDNEKATYKVGTNIPYKKGINFGSLSSETPFGTAGQNIDRKDLQLELVIKPHISNDESILLELKHDAADLVDNSSELGPTWSTRSFETRVLVRDQQTVVIGGLMQERADSTTSKVPILGDIPILGHLFKYTRKTKKKTNLVIMLTPYIIKDQLDLQALRERKVREHEEFAGSLTALRSMKYQPRMDYARKRGLVEEINRVLVDVETDALARKALHEPQTVTPGAVEY